MVICNKGVDVIVPKKRVLTIKEAASLIDGLTPFRKYLIYEENLYKVVLCEGAKSNYNEKVEEIAN